METEAGGDSRRRGNGPRFDGGLMAIMEVSRDLVCLCRAGAIAQINSAGARLLKVPSPADLTGRFFADFLIPDYRPVLEPLLTGEAIDTRPIPTRLVCLDGSLRDIELQVFRAREIAPDATVTVCRDTSRVGRLASLAQEQDARIHLMVDNAMNLVGHIEDGCIRYVNDAGVQMMGATGADQLAGLCLPELFHPDYADLVAGEMLEGIVAEAAPVPMRLLRLDGGGVVDAMVKITRLPSQRGAELMVEARDITAHNRAVVALRGANETLERRVVERTADLARETERLNHANAELERANTFIQDGIRYASRIQSALLPEQGALNGVADEFAVGWLPLDMVSGDIYWAGTHGGKGVVAVMDCTGHGVPGAFMTAVVASSFSRVLHHHGHDDPAAMLADLNRLVKTALHQNSNRGISNDGLDAALCVIDPAAATVTFAGANLPLLIGRGGVVEVVKPDRMSLGYVDSPVDYRFSSHRIAFGQGDTFYLLTDGVMDQIGGPNRRLFGRYRVQEALVQAAGLPVECQLDALLQRLEDWRGGERRRDDMTFLAFRPKRSGVSRTR